jgi:hypothetical protein
MLPILLGAVISVSPKALMLEIGGRVFAKVTASAASAHLKVSSSCYTTAGSSKDILKVTGINTQTGAKESTFAMDVRAQHAGKCTITFTSDANSATVNVDVKPEEP